MKGFKILTSGKHDQLAIYEHDQDLELGSTDIQLQLLMVSACNN